MAIAPTSLQRLFLRGIKWDCEAQEITLAAALKAIAQAKVSELKDGRYIQSSGLGGASVTFSFPDGLGPTMIAETVNRMLDLYDAADAAIEDANDDQRFAWMMAAIKETPRIIRPDFSALEI